MHADRGLAAGAMMSDERTTNDHQRKSLIRKKAMTAPSSQPPACVHARVGGAPPAGAGGERDAVADKSGHYLFTDRGGEDVLPRN